MNHPLRDWMFLREFVQLILRVVFVHSILHFSVAIAHQVGHGWRHERPVPNNRRHVQLSMESQDGVTAGRCVDDAIQLDRPYERLQGAVVIVGLVIRQILHAHLPVVVSLSDASCFQFSFQDLVLFRQRVVAPENGLGQCSQLFRSHGVDFQRKIVYGRVVELIIVGNSSIVVPLIGHNCDVVAVVEHLRHLDGLRSFMFTSLS